MGTNDVVLAAMYQRLLDMEARFQRIQELQNALERRITAEDDELREAIAFIRDVRENKYPTKPRIISAANSMLTKLGWSE